MTVSEAFGEFKSDLELPDRKQQQASVAQQAIRAQISAFTYVNTSFLSGSYARHTKIHPLDDIDVMLIMNEARVGLATNGSGTLPGQALDRVVGAVREAYGSAAAIKKQARSVNVKLGELEFGFDLIPAWYRQPDGYWIPDTEYGSWLPTDPDAHARHMTQANELCGGKLKPVIKMLKHWNRNNYDLFRSFHLELICARSLNQQSIPNFQTGVTASLLALRNHVGITMVDPTYGLYPVDRPLSAEDATKLSNRVNADSDNALEALRLERNGRHQDAIEKWKYIFLTGFPA